ncbi:hypothetical protein ACIQM4_34275 [Streptomyces sp. NPDC091272]|uniref:hypothetical protein n=1 Tax=Streptomyces sp. NPDC091272 TaxID=3365981 RepID=UPI0038241351
MVASWPDDTDDADESDESDESDDTGESSESDDTDECGPAPVQLWQYSVSARTAASMLGLDPRVVSRRMRDGTLDSVRVGQKRYVPLPSLFAYRRQLRPDLPPADGAAG